MPAIPGQQHNTASSSSESSVGPCPAVHTHTHAEVIFNFVFVCREGRRIYAKRGITCRCCEAAEVVKELDGAVTGVLKGSA